MTISEAIETLRVELGLDDDDVDILEDVLLELVDDAILDALDERVW